MLCYVHLADLWDSSGTLSRHILGPLPGFKLAGFEFLFDATAKGSGILTGTQIIPISSEELNSAEPNL